MFDAQKACAPFDFSNESFPSLSQEGTVWVGKKNLWEIN